MKRVMVVLGALWLPGCALSPQGYSVKSGLFATSAGGAQAVAEEAAANKEEHRFGRWRVSVEVDDFEGEIKPTLSSEVLDIRGKLIGHFNIGYFSKFYSSFSRALVSPSISGLSGSWPDCDYEFTRYKIDASEAAFYPQTGYACASLVFDEAMADKFKRGQRFRFSSAGQTGIVDLRGFTKAWEYALSRLEFE